MAKASIAVLLVLLLASGCGGGEASCPSQPEGEFERLRGPEFTRAKELYASGDTDGAAAIMRRLAADESWEVRARAIQAIGDAKDGGLLPEVHQALADPNIEVRESAGRVLTRLGDDTSIPALLKALSDGEPVIRIHAVDALARIAGSSHIETLERVAKEDDDPGVRSAAAEALERIASGSNG